MLELQHIYKIFDGKTVLQDINLKVQSGTTHALIGSSGSGKTTLLRLTLGLIPLDKGYVKINGQPLLSFSRAEWADKIGYIPQDGGLFPHLSARENVVMVARLRGWERARLAARFSELVSLVDLNETILDRFPHELSGGQQQRIAIMRAAFMDPPVMLLDEPMGALDPLVRRDLQHELKTIFHRLKKTVVIVTHDLSEAVFLAERITLLYKGCVMQTGTYEELVCQPADPFVSQFISAHPSLPAVQGRI